ncbi:MAG: tRNA uridine-5-carboxymethylaminomethyl(34) synthesis GTPase MnmE [Candidatus Melainabacteria bacterium GWF2_37_15]|nr:MAG: tRNA uridine-5-carboxymethylaminomethyl(34) synthesis GTPase MnmE [Candidatus Melainabacteria bacterium GWF2_37_15]
MNTFTQTDTIAAIATPLGVGGIGVVRLSGEGSEQIIKKIFKSKIENFEPNKIYHGWIHEDDTLVDEVVLLYFKAPNSFTGEDVFEIQCHGGINIVKKILKLCLSNGARLAERGEFSQRAFMNGKMDLSKAEAVLDLIHAKTDRFAQASVLNLSGRLAEKIGLLRAEVLNLLSLITAAVDFPDDVDEPAYSQIEQIIESVIFSINEILGGSVSSNLMREGVKVAIVGKPNAGKSSLFNALLDANRAIVTEIPGTTRDVIQESIDIDGIPVVLIDTAGLRESDDYIESIGINLTKETMENSDIILYIYDLTCPECIEISHKNVIKVGSKADLADLKSINKGVIAVSSTQKTGLEALKQEIKNNVAGNIPAESDFCTNLRQQACLKECKESLEKALEGCENCDPQDLISIDLKSALISLGEITGEVVSEEILDNIFSSFCIGK